MTGVTVNGGPADGGAKKPSLLFVCVENSNRSQMAEAFARMLGGDAVIAASAGSRPSGIVNPKAIATMAERGYDLTTHRSKSVEDACATAGNPRWTYVITMGCGDACPWVPAENRDDWPLPDPRELDADGVSAVRNEVERRVKALFRAQHINHF